MRAVSLHRDVIVVTSALLRLNCVIVRAAGGEPDVGSEETLLIDSPVLPEELDALPALVEQARFAAPSGLLATHGDWDHLLGRLAFPGLALGVSESTAQRLAAQLGGAQRELRAFDEELYIERPRALALGSVQALPVPGRCAIGNRELELHPAEGHTGDGMAIVVPWAGVLVAGDYLSTLEIPTTDDGGDVGAYLATLERLRPFVADAEHVIPGHGPLLSRDSAIAVLDEDIAYLRALERGADATPPDRGRYKSRHAAHARNLTHIAP